MQTVTSADGTSIGYEMSGSGPPLVLVHGTTADHTRWTPILPYFEPHFTVYALDRRGRGGSGDAPDYDLMREAEDVAAVVDVAARRGTRANVLGHSYGGLCSLEAALLTDNMHRLVLYEPPVPNGIVIYPPGLLDRMEALIERSNYETALELFFREVVKMPEHEFEVYRQLPVWPVRVSLAPTVLREEKYDKVYVFDPQRFARLRVPTLLLKGENSPSFFHAATAAVHAALPNSRVVVLAGQQHVAMDTDPELFTREVLQFLQDTN